MVEHDSERLLVRIVLMLQPGVDELHFLVVPIPAPTLGSRFRFPVLEGLVMVPIPEPWQKERLAEEYLRRTSSSGGL